MCSAVLLLQNEVVSGFDKISAIVYVKELRDINLHVSNVYCKINTTLKPFLFNPSITYRSLIQDFGLVTPEPYVFHVHSPRYD